MNALEQAREVIRQADEEMAHQFVRRMEAVETVTAYKQENGLPVKDPAQEQRVMERNLPLVENPAFVPYYRSFLAQTVALSRAYQEEQGRLPADGTVTAERGILSRIGEKADLNRRVLIVTDEGVPAVYGQTVAGQCRLPTVVTVPQGEESKSLSTVEKLLTVMLKNGFTRQDCVAAVGGGVVGDLAGFVAATYMRGVDFINIPTTLLAQADSSVGGKTAVNVGGIKNIAGAFYPPKAVFIDGNTLATLPARQKANGMAEVIKMALILDKSLFEDIENAPVYGDLDTWLARSIALKRHITEQDEKEHGLRKILNFGHTVGHAVESQGLGLYHGECVALGMLALCAEALRPRVERVLAKYGLPLSVTADREAVFSAVLHDKKGENGGVTVVKVPEIGKYTLENVPFSAMREAIASVVREETR